MRGGRQLPFRPMSRELNLYLVRHGETTANAADILQGQSDYPLTERGHSQSIATGQALKATPFSAAYSSDLFRAYHTACLIAAESEHISSKDVIRQSRLIRELHFGVRENMKRGTSVKEAKAELARERGCNIDDVIDNAESLEDCDNRLRQFLHQLFDDDITSGGASEDKAAKNVLVVSHGGFLKRFLSSLCGITIDRIANNAVSRGISQHRQFRSNSNE